MTNIRIFGLGDSANMAASVVDEINKSQGSIVGGLRPNRNRHLEIRRPDGEAYTTSLDNVRGCDVFVISSLYGDGVESVDEKFMKAAIFVNTLRHASASRITLVTPYLCYMRQDRKRESRAPIATQSIAMMLESVGVDRLLTMDVHNLGAEQNAFRIPIDNLEARKLLADAVVKDIESPTTLLDLEKTVREFKVLTPDAGGTQRTKLMQHSLAKRLNEKVGIVYADKTRADATNVKVQIIGDVHNRNIIVVDDLISTGGTIEEVKRAISDGGGYLWGVVATHGLFVNGAPYKLADVPRIYVTDTVKPFRLAGTDLMHSIKVVPTASMFAEAICRIHCEGGSISELLDD